MPPYKGETKRAGAEDNGDDGGCFKIPREFFMLCGGGVGMRRRFCRFCVLAAIKKFVAVAEAGIAIF